MQALAHPVLAGFISLSFPNPYHFTLAAYSIGNNSLFSDRSSRMMLYPIIQTYNICVTVPLILEQNAQFP